MEFKYILESLNQYLEDKRFKNKIKTKGHFILSSYTKIPSSFTLSIKEVYACLWYILGNNKYEIIVVSELLTDSSKKAYEDTLYKLSISLLKMIYGFIDSAEFNKILRGEYHGIQN